MGGALTIGNSSLCNDECLQTLSLLMKLFPFICTLIVVILGSISYGYIRRQQTRETIVDDKPAVTCEVESNDVSVQRSESQVDISPSFAPDTCEISANDLTNSLIVSHGIPAESPVEIPIELPEVSVSPSVAFNTFSTLPIDEVIPSRPLRQLICYCDGSYSHRMQVGYSGFRTSNGYSKVLSCPPRCPRSGSTETEVFAARLALQHAAQCRYDIVILHTDNSKVEQLLKRPKPKDYDDYPEFFQALHQCHQQQDDINIEVERVRGHTTRYEQQQCQTKREFAKVDRLVRQKLQQHARQTRSGYEYINHRPISYSYRYDSRYIRIIHEEKFGATLVITSKRRTSSYS